jgi:putative ABC transport system permease protein
MSLRDTLDAALDALKINRGRALLTIIGMGIAVASLIILLSIGDGVQYYIIWRINQVGADIVTVRPETPTGEEVEFELTMRDYEALAGLDALAESVSRVVPEAYHPTTPAYNGNEAPAAIVGTTEGYVAMFNLELVDGRWFTAEDRASRARVVVVDDDLYPELFPDLAATGQSPVGERVLIDEQHFTVIGLLKSTDRNIYRRRHALFMPLETYRYRLDPERPFMLSAVLMQAADSNDVGEIAEVVDSYLTATRHEPRNSAGWNVDTAEEIVDSMHAVGVVMRIFMTIIAAVTLAAGGVGIMNVMLMSVRERTAEIGLRKAIGARRIEIIRQFLLEATILSLAGGLIGVVLSFGFVTLVGAVLPHLAPAVVLNLGVKPVVVALAVMFSGVVGLTFGLRPARRAADLEPVEALRA